MSARIDLPKLEESRHNAYALIIAAVSLVIIAALYELLVRRSNVLRFLFGMKPLLKTTVRRRVNRQVTG
jgi:hypothetical protein